MRGQVKPFKELREGICLEEKRHKAWIKKWKQRRVQHGKH